MVWYGHWRYFNEIGKSTNNRSFEDYSRNNNNNDHSQVYFEPNDAEPDVDQEAEVLRNIRRYLTKNSAYGKTGHRDIHLQVSDIYYLSLFVGQLFLVFNTETHNFKAKFNDVTLKSINIVQLVLKLVFNNKITLLDFFSIVEKVCLYSSSCCFSIQPSCSCC